MIPIAATIPIAGIITITPTAAGITFGGMWIGTTDMPRPAMIVAGTASIPTGTTSIGTGITIVADPRLAQATRIQPQGSAAGGSGANHAS